MIGKRVITIKRPAVLFAAAFVLGIVLVRQTGRYGERLSGLLIAGSILGLFAGYVWFLRSLQKGRRRVSTGDKLLGLVPVFVLLGCFVMRRETAVYEQSTEAFAASTEAGKEVLAEGKISYIGRTKSGVRLELAEATVASYAGEEAEYRPVGTVLVYTEDLFAENGELKYGQRIFVYGNGSGFEKASNPGCFDGETYYFSLGITGAIHGKTIRITNHSYHRLNQALFQAKNRLTESYVAYLGEEGAGVISSMLLGERALLSEETEELYRHGGISHILAISGLHVSLIGMALYGMFRKTILSRNGAIPLACAGVILYGTFVEAGTSTKRAVIMFLLLLLATVLGRTYDTLSAMSVSVIVILWGSPGALYTASFQLSFAAAYGASVLAMMLREHGEEQVDGSVVQRAREIAARAESKWGKLREYLIEKIRSMFVFGLAIQAATFPFTVYHFFEYPTYGFLLNPIVVPLMTILLLCGLLSGVSGLFLPEFGYFFAGGTKGILWIYETLCRRMEKLPGSLLLFGQPEGWQIGLYYTLLAVCLYVWQKGRKKRQNAVLLCLILLPLCLLPVPGAAFEVAFLDVDQGDGIVMRERGGAVLLMDGGSTGVQKVGEKRIIPYLKAQGIRVIDCAFVSHADSDHISGLMEILTEMPVYSEYRESVAGYTGTPVVKSIVLPEWGVHGDAKVEEGVAEQAGNVYSESVDSLFIELVELAQKKQVDVYYIKAGDRMTVGKELVLSCLAPEEGVAYDNKNAASMVLLASYGEFDLLLTGDMEKEGELRLLESGALASDTVEVLKVSHHGSYTASSEKFISMLRPRISVISCGKDNRYGHPHTETLETLYEANSRVYRTDEGGCVTVKVGKKRMQVDEFGK